MGNERDSSENGPRHEFVDQPRKQFVEQPRANAVGGLGTNPHPRRPSRARASLRVDWPRSPPAVETFRPPSVVQNPLANSIEVGNVGWLVRANVFYDPGRGCVPEPTGAEDWEVGFIQNVLEDEAVAQYQGLPNVIRLHYGGGSGRHPQTPTPEPPLLDALRNASGSTQAWLTPDSEMFDRSGIVVCRTWTRIRYGGGNMNPFSVSLIMRDTPGFSFYQRKTGSHERLLTLNIQTRFQIWLAAKAANASATDLASYHVLAQSLPFNFSMNVRGDWAVNPPRFTATQNIPRIQFPPQQCRGTILRVSGPPANDVLGGRLGSAGIGPRWRNRPEQTRGEALGL